MLLYVVPVCSSDILLLLLKLCSLFNWLKFMNERAPPAVFLLLASGPCLSGLIMTQGYVDVEKALWSVIGCTVSIFKIQKMHN